MSKHGIGKFVLVGLVSKTIDNISTDYYSSSQIISTAQYHHFFLECQYPHNKAIFMRHNPTNIVLLQILAVFEVKQ